MCQTMWGQQTKQQSEATHTHTNTVIILRQERQVKSAKRTPILCGNTQAGPSSKLGIPLASGIPIIT